VQAVAVNLQVLGSTFAFASQSRSPLSVFPGASLALVCTSFLGVVLPGFGAWTLGQAIRG
jgi:putative Ca2+/H+ antiporter (TMEM165/GDT1 family)